MNGGSIRVLWDAVDPCDVEITGGTAGWTVNGSAVTFPHRVTSSTTFSTPHSGRYTLSVKYRGMEIADTPDATRTVDLNHGEELIFSPSPDDAHGVARGLVGKGELVVNVTDYGTVGDGVANDAPAIQSAIDQAAATGGEVYLPKGTYLLGAALTLPSGVTLRGHSQRTAVLYVLDLAVSAVRVLGASAQSTRVQTGLRDLKITGPGKASGGTAPGVYLKWASVDFLLERCWISDFGSHGVSVEDAYSMTFRQSLFDSNGGDGWHGETNINNITFDRTISILNAGKGYAVIGGTTLKFLNADAESNAGAGIDLRYVTAPSLDTCHLEKNGTDGTSPNIYLHYRTGLSEKTTAANISGCLIQGSDVTQRGLVIDGASRTNVEGNWFSGHVVDHVQTTADADRTWIGPNTYAGTGTQLTDDSASTVLMDYDATNLCARTNVLRYEPRSLNPAVLAQGQVWWASGTDQIKARDASRIRTVFSGVEATATLDFPSIAAQSSADLTITVTGAATGDRVALGPPINLNAGLVPYGFVSAADTVTVRVTNVTAGALDPTSAGWKVAVLKA